MFQEEAVGPLAVPGELMPAAEPQTLYWLYWCMYVGMLRSNVGIADVMRC